MKLLSLKMVPWKVCTYDKDARFENGPTIISYLDAVFSSSGSHTRVILILSYQLGN